MSCHFLLQRIFLIQGPQGSLLHWQAGFLLLSHKENPCSLLLFPKITPFPLSTLQNWLVPLICQWPLPCSLCLLSLSFNHVINLHLCPKLHSVSFIYLIHCFSTMTAQKKDPRWFPQVLTPGFLSHLPGSEPEISTFLLPSQMSAHQQPTPLLSPAGFVYFHKMPVSSPWFSSNILEDIHTWPRGPQVDDDHPRGTPWEDKWPRINSWSFWMRHMPMSMVPWALSTDPSLPLPKRSLPQVEGIFMLREPRFLLICCCSIPKSCPTLCDPWTAAHQASLSFTIFQSLLKLMSIELVMPSNHLILSSPSPPARNLSQNQGLFQWVGSSHLVAKVLELQHQSFQWIFKVDFL